MKTTIIPFALASVASLLAIPAAQAQPSCAIVADPLILLVGTWTFDMDGFAPPPAPFASAGRFTASIRIVNGVEIPTLTITQSTSDGARLEADNGSYQIFSDCSGGTLAFNTSSRPLVFDFWFDEFYGEIRFVSTTSGLVIVGTAERIVLPDGLRLALAANLAQHPRGSALQGKNHRFHYIDNKQADAPDQRQ